MSRRFLIDVFSRDLPDYPRGLSFSADGATVAVGTARGTVHVHETATGAERFTFECKDAVAGVAHAPVHGLLAVGDASGTTTILDSNGVRHGGLSSLGAASVEVLAWSTTARLAVAAGRRVSVTDASGAPLFSTEAHESTVTGVCWNPAGTALYTACYGGIRRFDLSGPAPSKQWKWKGSLISLALSPDEAVVAAATQDCGVHFWRLSTGHDSEMSGYATKPRELAWSHDSALLATGGSVDICVWKFEGNGPEGTRPLSLRGHEQPLTCLAFSPRERLLASGAEDNDVLLWDLSAGLKPVSLAPMTGPVASMAFSPSGAHLAACDAEGRLTVWAPRA